MIEIYNEMNEIKNILEHGFGNYSWIKGGTLLAKYFRDEGYKKSEVKKTVKEKCEKYCSSYKPNKGDFKKVDKFVDKVFKKDKNGKYIESIRQIDSIEFTKDVLKWFLDLEDNFQITDEQLKEEKEKREKVSIKNKPINFNRIKYLFTLFVWTKIQENYLERPNVHYLKNDTTRFKRCANLSTAFNLTNERNLLYDLGFIDINHAIGIIPIFMEEEVFKIPITDENRVVLSGRDLYECGYWLQKQKMGSFICQKCQKEFANYKKDNKGRPRKYCKECAKLLEHGEVRKIKKQLFCIDCGKPINQEAISKYNSKTVRCVDCQVKHNNLIKKNYYQKLKKGDCQNQPGEKV